MKSAGHRSRLENAATRRAAAMALVALSLIAVFATIRWDVASETLPGRVGAPAAATLVRPAVTDSAPLVRLAVLGDVGTGDAHEWATADLVSRSGQDDPFEGLVLLGDNVYPAGDPDRLDATVFLPFAGVLDQGAVLLPVLGNHDVKDGNAAGQAEGLGMSGRWYAAELGPILFVALDSNLTMDQEQLAWLEGTLASARSPWVIVAMHHPAFSAGYHGSTADVQTNWVPIFERHGVDLVLAGHDHDYQRTAPIEGVTYIVSGAGAKLRPTGRADFTEYAASVRHFVDIGVWDDRIEVTAVSVDGAFDTVTIERGAEQDLP